MKQSIGVWDQTKFMSLLGWTYTASIQTVRVPPLNVGGDGLSLYNLLFIVLLGIFRMRLLYDQYGQHGRHDKDVFGQYCLTKNQSAPPPNLLLAWGTHPFKGLEPRHHFPWLVEHLL